VLKKINKTALVGLFAFLMVLSMPVFLLPVSASPAPKPSAGVTLTVTMLGDQQKPGVEAVKAAFLASDLGHGVDSVVVKSSGSNADLQLATLQTELQGGTLTSDLIAIDTVWTAPFADNGWIIKLDNDINVSGLSAFGSGIVASCLYKGSYYAYPYFMNLGVLYYRKDLMDLNGFTEADFDTWEELNATANYILNNVSGTLDNPDLVGYVGQLDAYEGGVVNFFEWCGSNGALDVVTSTGQVNIDTTAVNEAMTFLAALVAPIYQPVQGSDYIIPRYTLKTDEASSGNIWLANNSIFLRQWPYIYSLSEGNNMEFGIAPLPHFAGATGYKTSAIGGAIMAVPTSTTGVAREAAINFTKFLGMKDAQEAELTAIDPSTLQPEGNFPALLSVYANPPTGFEWIQNWSAQAALTLSRPVHPDYPLISSTIADYFSDLTSGVKSVDTALMEMQRDVQEIISGPSQPPIPGYSIAVVLLAVAFAAGTVIIMRKKLH